MSRPKRQPHGALQLPLPCCVPEFDWKPPRLADLPSWAGAKRVGIDIETRDDHLVKLGPGVRRGGFIAGVSFAIDDGPGYYLPMRHQGGGNLDPEAVLNYIADQAKVFDGDLVGANLSYDLDYLAEEGIWFGKAGICDVQIREPLIYELHDKYTLDAIGERRGCGGKDEELLREVALSFNLDPKKDLWRLPAAAVGPYAEHDARLPLDIYESQEKDIEKYDLHQIWALEKRVTPVLIKITRRGIPVDLDKLSEIERWSIEEERSAFAEIKVRTGVDIAVGNAMKAAAIAPALQFLGVKLTRGKNNQWSIDKDLLERLNHPVADAVKKARSMSQLRTTFCASTRAHVTRGRIHCSYAQLRREDDDGGVRGARGGRLAASHTNMQNQPTRFCKQWREIYIPETTEEWGCVDFSQQEPRLVVHYAEKRGLDGAKAAADKYRNDPNIDYHQMMADVTDLPRPTAKNVFLALCYGMGGALMCRRYSLGPTKVVKRRGKSWIVAGDEGQAIIDTFNARLPFAKQLAYECERVAKKRGYIRTLLGRICHFPRDAAGDFDWTYKALNQLIQPSAADQTKKAMCDVDDAGHDILLQVHDEFDLSTNSPEQMFEVAEIMCDSVHLGVPSKVDVEMGANWGSIKKVKRP